MTEPYTLEEIDALEKALHPGADAFVDAPADLMRNWRRRLLATARQGLADSDRLAVARAIYSHIGDGNDLAELWPGHTVVVLKLPEGVLTNPVDRTNEETALDAVLDAAAKHPNIRDYLADERHRLLRRQVAGDLAR
jgi:hypothetical protein